MASLNQIFLIGRVGHTPALKVTNQTSVCNITLAVDDRVKVNDQWTDQTEWFRCTAFGKTADVMAKYVKKGSLLFVSGKMKSRKYTGKDGIEKTAWEVTVGTLQLLDPKSEGEEQPGETQAQTEAKSESKPVEKQATQPESKPKQMKLEELKEPIKFPEPEDDELPF